MMNKRQDRLIAILMERQDWIKSRELAALLQVSDRTIRSDVDAVNKEYPFIMIESNVRSGYQISEEGRQNQHQAAGSDIPLTPGARCTYIIQRLLFEVNEINLTVLQGQIYVSGYSIDNDLKRIRKMLEAYPGLKLLRSGECIALEGDERSKRRFYKDLLVAEVQENFLNLDQLAKLYENFDLIEVKDIFVEVLDEYDYSINEPMFPMLILHAGTSIERMLHSEYINMDDRDDRLEETIEFQIAKTFFERISDRLHFPVKDGEIGLFALVIMGRRASNYTSDYVNLSGNWLNTKKLVAEVLERLYKLFGVDFREDADLIAGLKMHLHGLIERQKQNIRLENIFLEEIKRKYPLVFEMGIYTAEFLERRLHAEIADTESGFIALHLGAASERMNARRKYKAVAILPHNQSFSDMCINKISDMFHERMKVVRVFHLFEQEKVKELEPDLILTSFPINHGLDVLTVPISLFVDSDTESKVLQALNKLDKKGFQLEFTSHIGSLIRKEHYYQDLECHSEEEVIHYLCQGLQKEGIVGSEFEGTVLKREEMSPTSFVNTFAVPHAFGAFAKCSTIAVAQLKNPVKWGCFEVRLVMLFATNEKDQRIIKMFFDWISSVVTQPERLAQLGRSCTYDQFIEQIVE